MAHRLLRLPPPAGTVAPEIQAALIIKADLVIPKEQDFKGYIREEDIMDQPKKDRKTAIRLSQFEEYSDWQTQVIIDLHASVRLLDLRVATAEYERDEARRALIKQKAREKFFKWFGYTSGAALIVAVLKVFIDWLFK